MANQTATPGNPPSTLPVLRWWWVVIVAIVAALLTVAMMWFLLARVTSGSNIAQIGIKLDAIRTAFSVGIGTGGGFALWLAARRQRSTELQLTENVRIAAEIRLQQAEAANAAEFDARERRITDLYTKAVEQLGSDKAPVRLGGLYALERLANDEENHRQTVINVVCAYLRMPYETSQTELKKFDRSCLCKREQGCIEQLARMEELQVRLTAQKIIADSLPSATSSNSNTEPMRKQRTDISLDLRGATLVDFDLRGRRIKCSDFAGAKFISTAKFDGCRFSEDAWFFETTFDCVASFEGAIFDGRAIFTRTMFPGMLDMRNAKFHSDSCFLGVTFGSTANFSESVFFGNIDFSEHRLSRDHYSVFNMGLDGWPCPGFNFTGARMSVSNGSCECILPPDWRVKGHSSGAVVRVDRT
jgi:uncharacterized protein YjbI with pentapeptide repeats